MSGGVLKHNEENNTFEDFIVQCVCEHSNNLDMVNPTTESICKVLRYYTNGEFDDNPHLEELIEARKDFSSENYKVVFVRCFSKLWLRLYRYF